MLPCSDFRGWMGVQYQEEVVVAAVVVILELLFLLLFLLVIWEGDPWLQVLDEDTAL